MGRLLVGPGDAAKMAPSRRAGCAIMTRGADHPYRFEQAGQRRSVPLDLARNLRRV